MGVEFSVSVSGATLSAVWFYSGPGAVALPGAIALYDIDANLIHSEAVSSWSGAAGSGWVRAAFSSPPALTSGVGYRACVFTVSPAGNWYSATANYWAFESGLGGSLGITHGPLTAPNADGSSGGQDTFNAGTSLTYPASAFNSTNYWVDPEVTVSGSAVPTGMFAANIV
jgi:hypothetical protein